MEIMIVKMTVSTVLYILVTALVWQYWSKHSHSVINKIIIGIIFGLCSIASTHLGVNYRSMILNVRDIGPLAAGLFFDPVSGIIAGLIGGIERYIAGTFFEVGTFTTMACSISTCLAGFLSALLKVSLYKDQDVTDQFPVVHAINTTTTSTNAEAGAGASTEAGVKTSTGAGPGANTEAGPNTIVSERIITKPTYPPSEQALFIGAVTEVFHMYAVLITHRSYMHMALHVVRNCSVPMIVFTAIGLAACSFLIRRMTGDTRNFVPITDYKNTPIATRFHRRMLAAILVIFCINHLLDVNFFMHISRQEAESYLHKLANSCQKLYMDMDDEPGKATQVLPYVAMAMNDDALYMLYNSDKEIVSSLYRDDANMSHLPDEDFAICNANMGGNVFHSKLNYYGGVDLLCICREMDDDLYLMIGWRYDAIVEERINRTYETLLSDILLFALIYLLITELIKFLIIQNLESVNRSLFKIIEGDLDEKVNVQSSIEFVRLSDDINLTVSTLKGYIDETERRLEQELKLATLIQESALPHVFKFPRDDFEIYALMKPARQVGGDFYDFFFVDVDRLVMVIADVSGKGIPGAMFMMRAKAAIGNMAHTGLSTEEILKAVNKFLCEGNDAEMFVSVWIGIIDLLTGVMQCSNAGHEYPIVYRAGGEFELLKDKHSLVLAAMEDAPIPASYEITFHKGDRLFVYTDGAPEAINKQTEAYGTSRMIAKLNTLKKASEVETLNAVYQNIADFVGEAEQFDDITLMGFTYLGTATEESTNSEAGA